MAGAATYLILTRRFSARCEPPRRDGDADDPADEEHAGEDELRLALLGGA